MLSAEGCRQRRQRLLEALAATGLPLPDPLVLADPAHLIYLANFFVDPFSLGAGFGGLLFLRRDGHTTLIHGNHLPKTVEQAHVDERRVTPWYDGQSPARCPRELAPLLALAGGGEDLRVHDRIGDPAAPVVVGALAWMRRSKAPDELAVLNACMRAGEAGHAWARANLRPGMTELDVYRGVSSSCVQAAGRAVVVYGDFAVSTGPERIGGPPSDRVLEPADLFILDFSVVIHGYRGDFTNTLVVGGAPTADQAQLARRCAEAMAAGERELRAGAPCLAVYDAVRGAFERAGVAEHFPHHAGHGIGLSHPEAPFFVRHATETLVPGDVVTLEPGLYVPGLGGIRIERNYHVTADGFECLSRHVIDLKGSA